MGREIKKQQIDQSKKESDAERMQRYTARIIQGFSEGIGDDELSKELGISELQVGVIRGVLGLKYKSALNVFEESKTLQKDSVNEAFLCNFRIPVTVHDKIGIQYGKDYHFIVSVQERKKLIVNIMEK